MPIIVGENQATKTAKEELAELASIAKTHAAKIQLIFNAIVTADKQAENADDRFVRITSALNHASIPNAFRTLVMTAFTSETGLSFSFGNIPAVIVGTRQAFNSFARRFFSTWAIMLIAAEDS